MRRCAGLNLLLALSVGVTLFGCDPGSTTLRPPIKGNPNQPRSEDGPAGDKGVPAKDLPPGSPAAANPGAGVAPAAGQSGDPANGNAVPGVKAPGADLTAGAPLAPGAILDVRFLDEAGGTPQLQAGKGMVKDTVALLQADLELEFATSLADDPDLLPAAGSLGIQSLSGEHPATGTHTTVRETPKPHHSPTPRPVPKETSRPAPRETPGSQPKVEPVRPTEPPRDQHKVGPVRPTEPPRDPHKVEPVRPTEPPRDQHKVEPVRPTEPPRDQHKVEPVRPAAPPRPDPPRVEHGKRPEPPRVEPGKKPEPPKEHKAPDQHMQRPPEKPAGGQHPAPGTDKPAHEQPPANHPTAEKPAAGQPHAGVAPDQRAESGEVAALRKKLEELARQNAELRRKQEELRHEVTKLQQKIEADRKKAEEQVKKRKEAAHGVLRKSWIDGDGNEVVYTRMVVEHKGAVTTQEVTRVWSPQTKTVLSTSHLMTRKLPNGMVIRIGRTRTDNPDGSWSATFDSEITRGDRTKKVSWNKTVQRDGSGTAEGTITRHDGSTVTISIVRDEDGTTRTTATDTRHQVKAEVVKDELDTTARAIIREAADGKPDGKVLAEVAIPDTEAVAPSED